MNSELSTEGSERTRELRRGTERINLISQTLLVLFATWQSH
jgi:hypothetical protein